MKLTGRAEYIPIVRAQLAIPQPLPFYIKIREPEKPAVTNIKGVEPLDLKLQVLGVEEFADSDSLWAPSVPNISRADYQFGVDLQAYAGRAIGFKFLLVEPHNKDALKAYLHELEGNPDHLIKVHQVVAFTGVRPWLCIALLTGN